MERDERRRLQQQAHKLREELGFLNVGHFFLKLLFEVHTNCFVHSTRIDVCLL